MQHEYPAPTLTLVQQRIADPAISIADIAHSVTESVMQAIDKKMICQGVEGGMDETGLAVHKAVKAMIVCSVTEMRERVLGHRDREPDV
jgi:hypothetical protein